MFTGSVPYHVGDVVELKKTHPCGSTQWEITRTGMDFGLRCVGCGRRVLIPRAKFEKQVKKIVRLALDAEKAPPGAGTPPTARTPPPAGPVRAGRAGRDGRGPGRGPSHGSGRGQSHGPRRGPSTPPSR